MQTYLSGSIYSNLKTLDVNDSMVFPIIKWNTLRATASVLKKIYGCIFRVRKTNSETIQVTRNL